MADSCPHQILHIDARASEGKTAADAPLLARCDVRDVRQFLHLPVALFPQKTRLVDDLENDKRSPRPVEFFNSR